MLFNILNVLEKIGLSAQKRAIHVQFSNELLNNQIFLQRIEGKHQQRQQEFIAAQHARDLSVYNLYHFDHRHFRDLSANGIYSE